MPLWCWRRATSRVAEALQHGRPSSLIPCVLLLFLFSTACLACSPCLHRCPPLLPGTPLSASPSPPPPRSSLAADRGLTSRSYRTTLLSSCRLLAVATPLPRPSCSLVGVSGAPTGLASTVFWTVSVLG